jgi:hypothetical protein
MEKIMSNSKSSIPMVTLYLPVKDVVNYPFFNKSEEDNEAQSNLIYFQRTEGKTDFILKGQIKEDVINGLNEFIEDIPREECINFTMACNPEDPGSSKFMFWNEKYCSVHNPSSFTHSTDPFNISVLMHLEDDASNLESLNDFNSENPEELISANLSLENVIKRFDWIKEQTKRTKPALSFKDALPQLRANEEGIKKSSAENRPFKRYVAIFSVGPVGSTDLKTKLEKTLFDFSNYCPINSIELTIPVTNSFQMTINNVNEKDLELDTSLYNLLSTMYEKSNCLKIVIGELSPYNVVLNTWRTNNVLGLKARITQRMFSTTDDNIANIEFKANLSSNVEGDRALVEKFVKSAGFIDGATSCLDVGE